MWTLCQTLLYRCRHCLRCQSRKTNAGCHGWLALSAINSRCGTEHRQQYELLPKNLDTIQWMEEELIDEMQDENARIPLDEKNKNILYTLNPREPKFFPLSISAMAKIFYAAKKVDFINKHV